jgi:thymidylate synthase
MAWKTMVTELLWFLRGDTNIKYLVENNCHIWDGDTYKYYTKLTSDNSSKWNKWMRVNEDGSYSMFTKDEFIEKIKSDDDFSEKWGELGPIYGKQWRKWSNPIVLDDGSGEGWFDEPIDQIGNLIRDLKNNPDSRRLMVNAWNVSEIDLAILPPCHYGFQVYTKVLSIEKRNEIYKQKWPSGASELTHDRFDSLGIPKRAISLMWNQRSCDFPLGIPMNIASYGLLLLMIADEVNMYPDELIGSLGDCHIYLNQIDGVKEQLTREPLLLPIVMVRDGIHCSSLNDVILLNYTSHPKINFPLSN